MLPLAVLRTSRHPLSASMLNKVRKSFALEPEIPPFSNLVEIHYSHICL
jgi:hypothetical protein